MKADIDATLQEAIDSKVFPGCTFSYIDDIDTENSFTSSLGTFTYDQDSPRVETSTLYDCASLTKIVGPMAIVMMLLDEGKIGLDDTIGTYLPEFNNQAEKASATLLHALTYTLDYDIPAGAKARLSQLPAQRIAANVLSNQLKTPPGTTYVYSNITAFILTQIVERVTREIFADLVNRRVFDELNMSTATLSPTSVMRDRIPPTEITQERGEVRGVTHDEFTYYTTRGGVSNGAAGLFASIQDMQKFLQMTIWGGIYNGKKVFSEKTVNLWTQDIFPDLLPTHTPLGWGDFNNELIDRYHREIVVKGGFTGCYLVADLQRQRGFVLLSNRTYPTRPESASAFAKLKETLMDITLLP